MDPVISTEKYQPVLQFLHRQLTQRASFSAPTAGSPLHLCSQESRSGQRTHNRLPTDAAQNKAVPAEQWETTGNSVCPSLPPAAHPTPCLPVLTSNFQLNATFLRFYPLPSASSLNLAQEMI